MSKRKSYNDKFRASAVLMYEADGNALRVAKHLGIPRSTLRSWVNRAHNNGKKPSHSGVVAEVYQEKKVELVDMLDASIRDAIGHLPDKWSEANAREIATAVGIFVDKKQLLTGGATERHEHSIQDRRKTILERAETVRLGDVQRSTNGVHKRSV